MADFDAKENPEKYGQLLGMMDGGKFNAAHRMLNRPRG